MAYVIRVKNDQDNPHYLFAKNFNTLEEFQPIANHCVNKRRIDFFESTLITVRTDTFRNFSKDFFFPTLTNHALKINDTVLKIIMTFACVCWDVCTFPIRLITLIPRYLYNMQHPRQSHPLHRYLLSNGVDPKALNVDHIYLERQWIEGRRVSGQSESDRNQITCGESFNFVQLPYYESPHKRSFSRTGANGTLFQA